MDQSFSALGAPMRSGRFTVNKISFTADDGSVLRGDLYVPENAPGLRPAVLVVHGGGWTSRSGDMSSVCRALASCGFVVLNTTYRLAPKYKFPTPVSDVKSAAQWLRDNSKAYRINPQLISAWGYSAGANLVLLAGLDGAAGFRSIVAGGTPADLTAWPNARLVQNFIGYKQSENPQMWIAASPVFQVSAQSPPIFMYHGAWDRIVEIKQMHKLELALRAVHRPVQTFTVDFMGHIGVYLFSHESVRRGIEFLRKNF